MTEPNGSKASIREVYQLVDARTSEVLAEMRSLATRVEGIDTRLQAHTQLEAHSGTTVYLAEVENKISKINWTLGKYAGGLAVLTTVVGAYLKFV